MATAKLWSCVGSAGTVNPPDIGKVAFVGSVAQMQGGSITHAPQVAARGTGQGAVVRGPMTQAVIRYGVTAVDGAINPSPNTDQVGLKILCRPSSGEIAARLVQVSSSQTQSQPSVTETTLVEFQASLADQFSWQQSNLGGSSPLDFGANVYYVEVVLSAGDVVTETPPAVSAIQLFFVDENSGGGGGGGQGTGSGLHQKDVKRRGPGAPRAARRKPPRRASKPKRR